MEEMTIRSAMTDRFESVAPDDTLLSVVDLMNERRLSCIPVVEAGVPIGVISERDVLCLLARNMNGSALPATARGLMSGPPITIRADASVEAGVRLQNQKRIRRLLVVDRAGRLVGILTQSDLVAAQTEVLRRERDKLEIHISERTEELRLANERLQHMSLVDPMLGTGNRRALDQQLAHLQGLAERFGRSFAILMLDIDDFKKFNDQYGHPEADAALADVVTVVQQTIRPSDVLFRFGGEEFVVTLPETGEEGAIVAAERIRGAVEGLRIPHELSSHDVMTVSVGVSSVGPNTGRVDTGAVVREADASLYQAKQAGRNRVGGLVTSESATGS